MSDESDDLLTLVETAHQRGRGDVSAATELTESVLQKHSAAPDQGQGAGPRAGADGQSGQKSDDVDANIYCTYFEGGIGKELNKDYFNIKESLRLLKLK